jgi:hypothetical protein
MSGSQRVAATTRVALKTFAFLLTVRGLSNFLKPFDFTTGFVFFGVMLDGVANAILSPLFGIYMLVTAQALFAMRARALPLTLGYAAYTTTSMAIFAVINPQPRPRFYAIYLALAIGVTWGASWLLYRRRDWLR